MGILKSLVSSALPLVPIMSLLSIPRADFGQSSSMPTKVQFKLQTVRDKWDTEYDYVIIGGGSAGAVLANRLSEDPHVHVLLLEAGGTENLISDIPLAYMTLQQTPMDWAYLTEPQRASCFGHKNRVRI